MQLIQHALCRMAPEAEESVSSMKESDLSFELRRDLLASAWLPKVQFLMMLLMRMIKPQSAVDQSQSRKQSYLSLSEMQLCCWPCLDSVSCPGASLIESYDSSSH